MRLLGWGLVVVLVDLRLNHFDLLPDVLGWALVCGALLGISIHSPSLHRSWCAALVGAAASAVSFALFFSESAQHLALAVLDLVERVAWLAMVWFLLNGLARRARHAEPVAAVQAQRLARVLTVANLVRVLLAVGALVAGARSGSHHWPADGVATVAGSVGGLVLCVHVALVAFVWRHAERDWLRPAEGPTVPVASGRRA